MKRAQSRRSRMQELAIGIAVLTYRDHEFRAYLHRRAMFGAYERRRKHRRGRA